MVARGLNSNWSDEINKKKVKLGEKPIHIRAGRFEEVQASGNVVYYVNGSLFWKGEWPK
jgi:hypothetical protein